MTGISHRHTQQNWTNTSNLLSSSRAEPTTTSRSSSTFLSSFEPCFFTILGGGGGTTLKCDQLLRRNERWICSGTRSIIFNDDISASFLLLVRIISGVPTEFWLIPLLLQLQYESQEWDSVGESHRRQSEKEKKKFMLNRSRTSSASYRDLSLRRVRPGLMSFRGRLGVALCRANKESVCACVCRDVEHYYK